MDIWVVATFCLQKLKYFPLSYSFLDIREGLMQEAVRREDSGRREYNPGWWEQGDLAVGSVSQVLSHEREPRKGTMKETKPGGCQVHSGKVNSRRESWCVSGGTSLEVKGAMAGSGQSHAFISLGKKYPNF